jgi:hypothetical protein
MVIFAGCSPRYLDKRNDKVYFTVSVPVLAKSTESPSGDQASKKVLIEYLYNDTNKDVKIFNAIIPANSGVNLPTFLDVVKKKDQDLFLLLNKSFIINKIEGVDNVVIISGTQK